MFCFTTSKMLKLLIIHNNVYNKVLCQFQYFEFQNVLQRLSPTLFPYKHNLYMHYNL